MHSNWSLLCRLTDPVQAGILQGVLEAHDIPVILLDKRDTSYLHLLPGEIEVYVPPLWSSLAAGLMSRALMN
ncbi:MAG: DUF2007 domain-containing protein [Bacteroidetes bacterium]|nr:DUF2007 domain-containing protein [Bacteroidota bacterium]